MVVVGIITVGDIKEFGVILGPLVTLVAAAASCTRAEPYTTYLAPTISLGRALARSSS